MYSVCEQALIRHMVQADPSERLSANEYLHMAKGWLSDGCGWIDVLTVSCVSFRFSVSEGVVLVSDQVLQTVCQSTGSNVR